MTTHASIWVAAFVVTLAHAAAQPKENKLAVIVYGVAALVCVLFGGLTEKFKP